MASTAPDYRDTLPSERAGHREAPWRVKPGSPAARMAAQRRDSQDTLVAHINPAEADLLKAAGGRGTVNKQTGALEFATADNFDAAFYLAQNPDVAAAGVDPWQHYQQHGQSEGRVARQEEAAARAEGYGGIFGSGGYVDWKNQQQSITPMPTDDPAGPTSGRTPNSALNDYLRSQLPDVDPNFDGKGGFWAAAERAGYPRHHIENLISGFTQNFDPVTGAPLRPEAEGFYNGSALARHGMYGASGQRTGGGTSVGGIQTPGGASGPDGQTGVPANPGNAYAPRDYQGNVRRATPAGLAAYYQSQGMGGRPYGTVGGEHNFFPNRAYTLPEIVEPEDDDDGGTGGTG